MLSLKKVTLALCSAAVLCLTGCVAPMCGPHGHCGPVAFGSSCDGCGACDGCGEMYIDPWINHPPECCDPCDSCGTYNGHPCGHGRSIFSGFATIWGYRCEPLCDDCGVASCGCDGAVVMDHGCDSGCTGCATCGIEPSETMGMRVVPTPAETIVETVPSEVHYVPERSRKIFRPRPSIAVSPNANSGF